MAGRRRQRGGRRRWIRRTAYSLGGLFLALVVTVGVMYERATVPPVSAAARADASIFSYRDGTKLAQVGRLNRVPVRLHDVPSYVRGAVLAAEDRGFYHEPVISPKGFGRAVWAAVSGGTRQGGSGIAQQYVKVAYLSPKQTLSRKVDELFIAVKLVRKRSKDWIFEQYLNTVYFGRGAYGIQAAAQAYFRKDVGALTPAEGALLAGMIKAPSYYDPALGHTAQTHARWRYVIDGMMSTGVLPKGPPPVFPKVAPAHTEPLYGGQRGYLIERIVAELHARGFDDDQIYRRGLRVTTTLDPAMQAAAPGAVADAAGGDEDLQTGLAAVRPGTGEILAAYGGRDYLKHQYDNAFLADLPSGSSFYPFVLATALGDGIGLRSTFGASPLASVRNDDDAPATGTESLLEATMRSDNTVYARVGAKTGAAAAGRAGLPTRFPPPRVHAIDQAAAYAALAAGGRYAAPHIVAKVTDISGRTLLDVRPKVHRAFSAAVAADVSFALRFAALKGAGAGKASLPDRPVAAAIGTTDHNAAAWFCGYTPDVATAVVMYRASNRPLINQGNAPLRETTERPARIWRDVMKAAPERAAATAFPPPSWTGATRTFAPPSGAPSPTAPDVPRTSRSSARRRQAGHPDTGKNRTKPATPATPAKPKKPTTAPSNAATRKEAGGNAADPPEGQVRSAQPFSSGSSGRRVTR